MKNKQSRRIVPASVAAVVVFSLVVVLEALVIGGAVEVRGSTIARIAPWAYESFLWVVGELPGHKARNNGRNDAATTNQELSASALVDSFNVHSLLNDVDVGPDTNVEEAAESTEPATNHPAEAPKEVVPVG